MPLPKLRVSEWILLGFYTYIVALSPWFPARPNLHLQPLFILLAAAIVFAAVSALERAHRSIAVSRFRDWLPTLFMLIAFREMELFLPLTFDHNLELSWIRLDRLLLSQWHLRALIESFGSVMPLYLELCYLLVYGLPFYCIAVLYIEDRRRFVDRFLTIYLIGTLLAYALFPYFPSQPPRFVFPNLDGPSIGSGLRRLNLAILDAATIHVGVFPSAHVSSAFSAAWGLFLVIPKRKIFGWTTLVYAVSVSLATIYGRYHYTADVLAGFAVSVVAGAVARFIYLRGGSPVAFSRAAIPASALVGNPHGNTD